ncbi:unnamed protein product [Aphanomyces euteiches]|uniref:Uncharacterized protein n=1 Tax=Aphanomyces euteiches TaxID=100861 RepID=A0A6G0W6U2_9STRA|nr:hypothetical protein Ae201684_018840 [Aphanomyces euteiches]KAH9073896.1 hypothetical protein Ae201684P_003395 [Aphanomyces euteiches]KAH9140647.1 hypothetical protein AeRB84_015147 [Aphanomyces euteiches]
MQCRYAYKECFNLRTYKRDGSLHRYCELHRDKANALQRVYATKRRRELRQAKLHPLQTPATTTPSLAISQDTIKQEHKYVLDSPVGVNEWTPIEFWSPTRPDLSEEEYAYMYLNLVLMSS